VHASLELKLLYAATDAAIVELLVLARINLLKAGLEAE